MTVCPYCNIEVRAREVGKVITKAHREIQILEVNLRAVACVAVEDLRIVVHIALKDTLTAVQTSGNAYPILHLHRIGLHLIVIE